VLQDVKIRCTTDGNTSDKLSRLSLNLFSFMTFIPFPTSRKSAEIPK